MCCDLCVLMPCLGVYIYVYVTRQLDCLHELRILLLLKQLHRLLMLLLEIIELGELDLKVSTKVRVCAQTRQPRHACVA